MSVKQRHTEPVDVRLILRRDTAAGPELLVCRQEKPSEPPHSTHTHRRDADPGHALDRSRDRPRGHKRHGNPHDVTPAARKLLPVEEYASSVPKSTGSAFVSFTDEDNRPVQLCASYSQGHATAPGSSRAARLITVSGRGIRRSASAGRKPVSTLRDRPTCSPRSDGLPGDDWPFSTTGTVFDSGRLTEEQIRSIVLDPDEHDAVRILALDEWEPLMPPQDFARWTRC